MIAEMQVRDKVVVVTGGGHGIGEGLARRFKSEGARALVVADLDGPGAEKVASEIGGFGMRVDVSLESDIRGLVDETTERFGPIDLFCSNAGIYIEGGIYASDEDWFRIRGVNVLSHLYAARAVIPGMIARGGGYLLQTASAAGLLTAPDSALYAMTKHAAISLAEWISITYGDQGIKVSALCPMGVRTEMLKHDTNGVLTEGALSVEQVADAVIEGLAEERFLILPHPEVGEFFQRKANDYDRWLRGMRRAQAATSKANSLQP